MIGLRKDSNKANNYRLSERESPLRYDKALFLTAWGLESRCFSCGIVKDAFDNKYVLAYYVFEKTGVLRHFQAGGSGMEMLRKRLGRVLNEQ
ncbi:hypothetical protein GCM10020331_040240 [Ectobacillus funiculus]